MASGEFVYRDPYGGQRPWLPGSDIPTLGKENVDKMYSDYLKGLYDRMAGNNVGFPAQRRTTLRNEFLADINDAEDVAMKNASAQAAGQGLRGGTPMQIRSDIGKNYSRSRASGLANIDVADLAARREDINKAFYSLPGFADRGPQMQKDRSNFDLGVYQAESPTYVMDEPSSLWSDLLGAGAQLGSAYLLGGGGNPFASGKKNTSANSSFDMKNVDWADLAIKAAQVAAMA